MQKETKKSHVSRHVYLAASISDKYVAGISKNYVAVLFENYEIVISDKHVVGISDGRIPKNQLLSA